jgi:hypothetical protein
MGGEDGAILLSDHAGKTDQERDQGRGQGEGDFPGGEAQHFRRLFHCFAIKAFSSEVATGSR